MKKAIALASALILLYSCSTEDAFDPMTYAPATHYTVWRPLKNSFTMTSKFCKPLIAAHYNPDKLSLAELIDIALINNPDTKKTWAQAREAAAVYGEKLSPYYPEINVDASYTRERQTYLNETLEHPHKASEYYRTTVTPEATVTYTIFDFGQRRSTSEVARQSLYYADYTHNRQIQTVIQMVMNDYYNYLYQKQNLQAKEADLEDAKQSLDAANQKFAAGVASVGDVVQAKTKYLQIKIELSTQKEKVEGSFVQLAYDIGLPANFPFNVEKFPDHLYLEEMLTSVDELIQFAQTNRQDFLAMQAELKSQQAKIDYAYAADRPVIAGYFNIGKNWYNDHDYEDYHFRGMLKLSFPLFKGFFYKNQRRQAKALYTQSKASLEQLELSIVSDITYNHYQAKMASEIYKFSDDYLKASEEEFVIALSNYKAGTNTILDVLSAQSSLADSRAKKAQATRDWFSSLANLSYSTGSMCLPQCEACVNEGEL